MFLGQFHLLCPFTKTEFFILKVPVHTAIGSLSYEILRIPENHVAGGDSFFYVP